MNPRAQHLMKALVENYLRDGQPVGSKKLAEDSGLAVSSATIRNIMAQLEEAGLLTSPHTSAGRIPTAQGVRLFVDNLLTVRHLESKVQDHLRHQLNPKVETDELLDRASSMLSELTHMAGLVRIPRRSVTRIKRFEFIPLSEKQVLVVLILSDNEVQNRVIRTDRDFSRDELQQMANFLNQQLVGNEINSVREQLLHAMVNEKQNIDEMMQQAIQFANKGLDQVVNKDAYRVSGQANLVAMATTGDFRDLSKVFEAFNHKREVLKVLDDCLNAEGVQIFIGEESGYAGFGECSLVTAPYQVENKPVGVLAVIGPTRMPYETVIPIVDITAKLLSSALNQGR